MTPARLHCLLCRGAACIRNTAPFAGKGSQSAACPWCTGEPSQPRTCARPPTRPHLPPAPPAPPPPALQAPTRWSRPTSCPATPPRASRATPPARSSCGATWCSWRRRCAAYTRRGWRRAPPASCPPRCVLVVGWVRGGGGGGGGGRGARRARARARARTRDLDAVHAVRTCVHGAGTRGTSTRGTSSRSASLVRRGTSSHPASPAATAPLPPAHPLQVLLTSAGRVRLGSLGVPEVLLESPGYQDVGQVSEPLLIVPPAARLLLALLPMQARRPAPPACPRLPSPAVARVHPPTHPTHFACLQLQRGDLSSLGNLVLLLACVGRGAAPSLEYLTTHFSREFCHIVAGLLASAEGGLGLAPLDGCADGWLHSSRGTLGVLPRLALCLLASLASQPARLASQPLLLQAADTVSCSPATAPRPLPARLQAAGLPAVRRCWARWGTGWWTRWTRLPSTGVCAPDHLLARRTLRVPPRGCQGLSVWGAGVS